MSQNWKQFFAREKRWHQLVKAEVSKREIWTPPNIKDSKRKIWRGVTSALLFRFWSKARNKIVFVGFGNDPLIQEIRTIFPKETISAENKGKNLIKGQSLCELDAIYHLIHYPGSLNKTTRKILLSILMRWLKRSKIQQSQNIYIVKQDYYEKSSIITTLSEIAPIKILGLQHGLLGHKYLRETNIYPGIRTNHEAVYSKTYQTIFEKKKTAARLFISGPPIDNNSARPEKCGETSIVFVSSDDLRRPDLLAKIRLIKSFAEEAGYSFAVRPHPSEARDAERTDLPIRQEKKVELFSSNENELILIGFYSTLLYEAGHKGYKTIWVSRTDHQQPKEEFPEVSDLPNAIFVNFNEINSNWLKEFATQPLKPVEKSSFSKRISNILLDIRSQT